MANFGPLAAEICSGVWGTPANFNVFRVLASLLQRRRSPEVNQTLYDVWHLLGCYTDGFSPRAKFTLRHVSCVLLYWQRYCTALQPNFAAWYMDGIMELPQRAPRIFGWAAITLGIGPHSSLLWPPCVADADIIKFFLA